MLNWSTVCNFALVFLHQVVVRLVIAKTRYRGHSAKLRQIFAVHHLGDERGANSPTCTKLALSETKSCPMEGTYALAHCLDTGTTHVYSRDRAGTSHRAPRSVRM
jgi:hypothetical protein